MLKPKPNDNSNWVCLAKINYRGKKMHKNQLKKPREITWALLRHLQGNFNVKKRLDSFLKNKAILN